MKDKTKAVKEKTTKKAKKQDGLISTLNHDDDHNRITGIERLCSSHSALLSDQKGRVLALEIFFDNIRQEFADQRNRILNIESYLTRTATDFKESIGNCEHKIQAMIAKTLNSTVWAEIQDIKKNRKLIEWLVVYGFTMALVSFAWTITSVIKQMFY
jgi:hypothetical protein